MTLAVWLALASAAVSCLGMIRTYNSERYWLWPVYMILMLCGLFAALCFWLDNSINADAASRAVPSGRVCTVQQWQYVNEGKTGEWKWVCIGWRD